MKTASILGVHFHAVTMDQAIDIAMGRLRAQEKGYVVTPNPEIVELCRQDSAYMEIVNRAALVLPDGIGIIYAAKILGEQLQGKVAGVEFAEHLVAAMAKEKMRLFLHRGQQNVLMFLIIQKAVVMFLRIVHIPDFLLI